MQSVLSKKNRLVLISLMPFILYFGWLLYHSLSMLFLEIAELPEWKVFALAISSLISLGMLLFPIIVLGNKKVFDCCVRILAHSRKEIQ